MLRLVVTVIGTADAALAGLVIAVVGLMVVPLPTPLLDLLLAANLALSVAILLVSLYVSDALKIGAFPTLLLITTLIRLALNVSATRLILGQAYGRGRSSRRSDRSWCAATTWWAR